MISSTNAENDEPIASVGIAPDDIDAGGGGVCVCVLRRIAMELEEVFWGVEIGGF